VADDRTPDVDDLAYELKAWRESNPDAPDGLWYKDFGSFKICGEGKYPKTFLLAGQTAKGQKLWTPVATTVAQFAVSECWHSALLGMGRRAQCAGAGYVDMAAKRDRRVLFTALLHQAYNADRGWAVTYFVT
jgi:hypothetical protein